MLLFIQLFSLWAVVRNLKRSPNEGGWGSTNDRTGMTKQRRKEDYDDKKKKKKILCPFLFVVVFIRGRVLAP